ncbi:MAG: hypothetical protein HOV94_05830 [Saccharothrix sp.]|nr:hypothetical protein [Saccharothrix sp.]
MNTRRLFGATALLALTTGLLVGTASASPKGPAESDPRAVLVNGNLEWNHDNACATAGLTGEAIDGDPEDPNAVTLANSVNGSLLTITGGLEGYTVTGVVVKGGNAYNVYTAAKLGDLAWEDLRPPANASGGPAGISHWFFCVEKTTTPENPGGETPSETTTVAPTTVAPTTTAPTTTASIPVTPTSTTAPAAVAAEDNDLANTGFNGGWLLIAGLALVAAGAAFVASPKLRGLFRR